MSAITSQWMTKLILWRNPQGEERNWLQREQDFKVLPSVGTRALAECGFLGIAVASVVATVWHGFIAMLTRMCPAPRGTNGYAFMNRQVEQYKSAAFVVVWSVVNLLFNFINPNLLTTEARARLYAGRFGGRI